MEYYKFKKYTEEEQIEMVKKNGYSLKYIHNPSEEVCIEAVKEDGNTLQYVPQYYKSVAKYVTEHKCPGYVEYNKLAPVEDNIAIINDKKYKVIYELMEE